MLVARVEQDGDGGDGVVVVEIGIVHSTIFGVEVGGGVYYQDRRLFDGGGGGSFVGVAAIVAVMTCCCCCLLLFGVSGQIQWPQSRQEGSGRGAVSTPAIRLPSAVGQRSGSESSVAMVCSVSILLVRSFSLV